jgi:hypothetical protein
LMVYILCNLFPTIWDGGGGGGGLIYTVRPNRWFFTTKCPFFLLSLGFIS